MRSISTPNSPSVNRSFILHSVESPSLMRSWCACYHVCYLLHKRVPHCMNSSSLSAAKICYILFKYIIMHNAYAVTFYLNSAASRKSDHPASVALKCLTKHTFENPQRAAYDRCECLRHHQAPK